jgi:hypothetical protein
MLCYRILFLQSLKTLSQMMTSVVCLRCWNKVGFIHVNFWSILSWLFITFPDLAIQSNIMNSSWFKASKRLCAYISCAQLREVDTTKILTEVLSPNSGALRSPIYISALCYFHVSNSLVLFKNTLDKQRISMFLEWKIRIAICGCSKLRPWMI